MGENFKSLFLKAFKGNMQLVKDSLRKQMDKDGFITMDAFMLEMDNLLLPVYSKVGMDWEHWVRPRFLEVVTEKFDHGDGMVDVDEFLAALQPGWRRIHASSRTRTAGKLQKPRPLGDALREFVFMTKDIERPDLDLKQPPLFGLETDNWKNVEIPTGKQSHEPGTMNGWFLEPPSSVSPNGIAVLYLHGVTDTRGEHHRVGLYNLLNSLGYTVLAFDYRGFGDSTGTSTDEDTVVEDALAALRWLEDWIKENKPKTQLYVWGHSMGTGIGSSAMARYFRVMGPESRVKGLVLESPYNSFTDEFIYNIEMFPYKRISQLMTHPPQRPSHILSMFNMRFDSDIHILDIGCPVMILHAEDDPVIPFRLGKKLYVSAKDDGKKDVEFHRFAAKFGYQHSDIYKAPDLPDIIKSFLK